MRSLHHIQPMIEAFWRRPHRLQLPACQVHSNGQRSCQRKLSSRQLCKRAPENTSTMSGVEIAGFVLGGFPLLISAAEHYKGFEPLVKWKRFRTDFIGFIDAIDIEKQLFNQMLERFLISADVPQEDLQSFMTIQDYEGWRREDLASVLETRLGPSYSTFLGTVKTMQKLMAELQDMLLLSNGKVGFFSLGHVVTTAEANILPMLRSTGRALAQANGTIS